MKRVVCDTGPILHLQEAGALDILQRVGQIFIPSAVLTELVRWLPEWRGASPEWLSCVDLLPSANTEADSWVESGLLDPGESAALALARHLKADWFLTDDTAARLLASELGLEVHGALGVVLSAAARGHLSYAAARKTLLRLFESSLWVSQRVQKEALEVLEQLFQ